MAKYDPKKGPWKRPLPKDVADLSQSSYDYGPHITTAQGEALVAANIPEILKFVIIQDIQIKRQQNPDDTLLKHQDDFLSALLFSLEFIQQYAKGELYITKRKNFFRLTDNDLSSLADKRSYNPKDSEGAPIGTHTHHLRKEKLILNLKNVVALFSQDGKPVDTPIRELAKQIVDIFELDLPRDFPHRASILATKTPDVPNASARAH